mmetsp:Transcript_22934/g.90945  ORF Transcript_22934/g.90945 Transcript_22934/m.90945 type:complete len:338 (-) Transcript_22934:652-1665(-)
MRPTTPPKSLGGSDRLREHAARALALAAALTTTLVVDPTAVVVPSTSPLLSLHPPAGVATAPGGGMARVVRDCQAELAACAASPMCAQGLACAGTQPTSPTGQVRCMDLYENDEMRAFADCAMTRTAALPQQPADAAELASFERTQRAVAADPPRSVPAMRDLLRGTWRVALGLNPAFDAFECQVHDFSSLEEGDMVDAVFRYRVRRPDRSWFTREGGKRLAQPDAKVPYRLKLRLRPEYLDYEDDWLVLGASTTNTATGTRSSPAASDDDEWFVVRYHGANAAWAGYGGLNVYTRSGHLDPASDAAAEVRAVLSEYCGDDVRLEDLIKVDNSCPIV